MEIKTLIRDVLGGHRLSTEEAAALLRTTGRDTLRVWEAADELRETAVGDTVTYVRNQNIHITNICKNLCGFCGFGRKIGSPGAYCDDYDTVREKVARAVSRGVTEICLLSGVHPDFTLETYLSFLALTREQAPGVHIHAFSPDEVAHCAQQAGISTNEVLMRFREAGLGSLQGTAAEILVDDVRKVICPRKITVSEWIGIITEAHTLGIPTTATVMYGSCESDRDRAAHLDVIRSIQDRTRGFTEMVLLSYVHENTELFRSGIAGPGATGREDLLMTAVSRMYLDNIPNVQVAWGKLGMKLAQIALLAGGNDLAGTMFSDDVTGNAGGKGSDYLDPSDMGRMVGDIGRVLRERDTLYHLL